MGTYGIGGERPDDFLSRFRYEVPVNKFIPPRLASSSYLFRAHLIREILQKRGHGAKLFLIEAQGGQGKTTLAAQYLYDSNHNFAWYQVGPEDGDPIFFPDGNSIMSETGYAILFLPPFGRYGDKR